MNTEQTDTKAIRAEESSEELATARAITAWVDRMLARDRDNAKRLGSAK